MELNSEKIEFMNSDVQFFQNFLSELTEKEVDVVEIADDKPKKQPSQTKLNSKRDDKDTDTYNNKPNDPEYFKNYWRTKNDYVKCPSCGQQAAKLRLCKHKKSMKCIKLTDLKNKATILNNLD